MDCCTGPRHGCAAEQAPSSYSEAHSRFEAVRTQAADVAEPELPVGRLRDAVAHHVHAHLALVALQHLVCCCVVVLPAHLQQVRSHVAAVC